MNRLLKLTAIVAVLGSFSCSPNGKSSGNDYCKCNKEEGIINIAKCKKEVIENNKNNLKNPEFEKAFWKAVGDCN